jgi:hypothetical protein
MKSRSGQGVLIADNPMKLATIQRFGSCGCRQRVDDGQGFFVLLVGIIPLTRRSIMACISFSPNILSSAYQLDKLPEVGVANTASIAAASAFAFRIHCRYASRF